MTCSKMVSHMATNKSLDGISLISAMLLDAHASHGVVFDKRALRLTTEKVVKRIRLEGESFLTKTLYAFGRHLDKVLAGAEKLDPNQYRLKTNTGSKLPIFLGELIGQFISKDGTLLPNPDANCVRTVRQLLHAFGKLKLPHSDRQEQKVIDAFKSTENELQNFDQYFANLQRNVETRSRNRFNEYPVSVFGLIDQNTPKDSVAFTELARTARVLLNRVFGGYSFTDICPRHGPGAVATKQKRSEKFRWTNVSDRLTALYPFDEYFCSSLGEVCDHYQSFEKIGTLDLPAQVILVPKDSRGPRLISCEPVDKQWIQQGIMRSLVPHIEAHPLTRGKVNFTDQEVNRQLALRASQTGDDVTLDLKEASDRVHIDLVRLLYPEHCFQYLECCRSRSTVLPSGEVIPLRKFAPMGSALCFPIMALTIWALLAAGSPDADTRKSIYVYGDDVIVPTAFAESAITILESFGLRINRDKSCTRGFFRESCGMDAFQGICVTPVRFRTAWSESPSPSTYASWIEYSNSFNHMHWYATRDLVTSRLEAIYGPVPGVDILPDGPSLAHITSPRGLFRTRWNPNLHRLEYHLRSIHSPSHQENYNGWRKLLRYFTESSFLPSSFRFIDGKYRFHDSSFDAGQYTTRRTIKLVRRWR